MVTKWKSLLDSSNNLEEERNNLIAGATYVQERFSEINQIVDAVEIFEAEKTRTAGIDAAEKENDELRLKLAGLEEEIDECKEPEEDRSLEKGIYEAIYSPRLLDGCSTAASPEAGLRPEFRISVGHGSHAFEDLRVIEGRICHGQTQNWP
jgi:hypothetical protein